MVRKNLEIEAKEENVIAIQLRFLDFIEKMVKTVPSFGSFWCLMRRLNDP